MIDAIIKIRGNTQGANTIEVILRMTISILSLYQDWKWDYVKYGILLLMLQ